MYSLFSSETFWVAVGSIGTISAVLMAVRQIRLSRLTGSADLLLRLEDRFDEEEFMKSRVAAATALKKASWPRKEVIEDVFDFFETVGILVRKGALNKELVWNSFSYWLHGYFLYGENFLKEQRNKFPARYDEAVWLHKALLKVEKSKRPSPKIEWKNFLEEENEILTSSTKKATKPANPGKA
jgi:hypothetical protein